jgi:ArsR family transcriptional regulator
MVELFPKVSNMSEFPSSSSLQWLYEMLKVLAEPNRLLIINLLMDGVQCNCEMGVALKMAPNLISHHLSVLRKSGLVDVERDSQDARWVYYSVNQSVLEELNEAYFSFFNPERIQARRSTCGPPHNLIVEPEPKMIENIRIYPQDIILA